MSRHLTLVFLLFAACSSTEPDGTAQMAAELEAIAAETDRNPRRNAHANVARAAALGMQTAPTALPDRIQYSALLGTELLRAGDSEAAAGLFEEILQLLEASPDDYDPSWRLAAMDHLALSHLRIGEQENCLVDHSASRCLFPIGSTGVHTLPRGSTMAIPWYEKFLKKTQRI
jgi:hypothetical protein